MYFVYRTYLYIRQPGNSTVAYPNKFKHNRIIQLYVDVLKISSPLFVNNLITSLVPNMMLTESSSSTLPNVLSLIARFIQQKYTNYTCNDKNEMDEEYERWWGHVLNTCLIALPHQLRKGRTPPLRVRAFDGLKIKTYHITMSPTKFPILLASKKNSGNDTNYPITFVLNVLPRSSHVRASSETSPPAMHRYVLRTIVIGKLLIDPIFRPTSILPCHGAWCF